MLAAIIALCIVIGIFFLIYFSYKEKQEYKEQNSDYGPDGFRNKFSKRQRYYNTRFR
tara:strand:- start:9797 stop:9967 length:171 start_codon:yes stop_codon:yes gene_type:complete